MEIKTLVFGLIVLAISCSNITRPSSLPENIETMDDSADKKTPKIPKSEMEIIDDQSETLIEVKSEQKPNGLLKMSYLETDYEEATEKEIFLNGEVWTYSTKRRTLNQDGLPIFIRGEAKWRLESKISEEGIQLLKDKLISYVDAQKISTTPYEATGSDPTIMTINLENKAYYAGFSLDEGQEISDIHLELITLLNAHISPQAVPIIQE